MASSSRASNVIESLKADLNAAADEMSDVAEALGLRRDAPHRRILARVAELRALERSTPPHGTRPKAKKTRSSK